MWYELMTLDPAMAAERRSFGFSIAQDGVALTASLGGYTRRHPRNTHRHDIELHHLSLSLSPHLFPFSLALSLSLSLSLSHSLSLFLLLSDSLSPDFALLSLARAPTLPLVPNRSLSISRSLALSLPRSRPPDSITYADRPSMHLTVMRNESAPQHIARSMAALELVAIIPNRSLSLVHATHVTRHNKRRRMASAC